MRLSSFALTALLCLAGCALFAGANALAKAALTMLPGPEMHPVQATAARFLFALLALTPLIARNGVATFRTKIPLRHLQRSALGAGGVTCVFAAAAAMPLADAVAIARAAPLFTLLFAALFLGEMVGRRRWAAAAVGFAGVVILMRPSPDAINLAALIAIAAAVFTGAELATVRVLATRDPALTVLSFNSLLGTLITCAATAFVYVTPSWQQALALAGVGGSMLAGQALMLRAFATTEASAVAPYYYATIAWAALFGVIFFDETPAWTMALGAALIVAGGIGAGLAGRRKDADPD